MQTTVITAMVITAIASAIVRPMIVGSVVFSSDCSSVPRSISATRAEVTITQIKEELSDRVFKAVNLTTSVAAQC